MLVVLLSWQKTTNGERCEMAALWCGDLTAAATATAGAHAAHTLSLPPLLLAALGLPAGSHVRVRLAEVVRDRIRSGMRRFGLPLCDRVRLSLTPPLACHQRCR